MILKPSKRINWKRRFWRVFSEYIRRRDKGHCFTCSTQKSWKEMHAGHYVSAGTSPPPLYFDEKNVHCQCVSCNLYKSGNLSVYAFRLVEKYGPEILLELESKERAGGKWNGWTYQEYIKIYKAKIEALEGK